MKAHDQLSLFNTLEWLRELGWDVSCRQDQFVVHYPLSIKEEYGLSDNARMTIPPSDIFTAIIAADAIRQFHELVKMVEGEVKG